MLGPIVLMITAYQKRFITGIADKSDDIKTDSTSENRTARVRIPYFIYGFIFMSIIATFAPEDTATIELLKSLSKYFLVIAMAAIGLKIKLKDLFKQGPKALLIGSIIFAIQIIFVVTFLLYF